MLFDSATHLRAPVSAEQVLAPGLLAGRVVIIAHAPRGGDTTRIISMGKANRREQKIYPERLGEG